MHTCMAAGVGKRTETLSQSYKGKFYTVEPMPIHIALTIPMHLPTLKLHMKHYYLFLWGLVKLLRMIISYLFHLRKQHT